MLKQILTGSSISVLLLLAGLPAQAQTEQPEAETQEQVVPETEAPSQSAPVADVSSEEVQQFARAIQQMQQIQTEAQNQAVQVLEEVQLSPTRFNEILQSQQNPQVQPTAEITPEEQQSFDQAYAEIAEIQESTGARMEEAIQNEGLEVDRFNEILALVQQNPQLRQQIEQELQGS